MTGSIVCTVGAWWIAVGVGKFLLNLTAEEAS